MLSIAIVHLAHEAANKASGWTGGSDGLSGIMPDALFGLYEFDIAIRPPVEAEPEAGASAPKAGAKGAQK